MAQTVNSPRLQVVNIVLFRSASQFRVLRDKFNESDEEYQLPPRMQESPQSEWQTEEEEKEEKEEKEKEEKEEKEEKKNEKNDKEKEKEEEEGEGRMADIRLVDRSFTDLGYIGYSNGICLD